MYNLVAFNIFALFYDLHTHKIYMLVNIAVEVFRILNLFKLSVLNIVLEIIVLLFLDSLF